MQEGITVGTAKIFDMLNDKEITIEIPEYQRPYIWGKEHIETLFSDFEEFLKDETKDKEYYLGTILLYKNQDDESYQVIDGQQRITTLLLIDYVFKKSEAVVAKHKDRLRLYFNSPVSRRNLIHNKKVIESELKDKIKIWDEIKERLVVSVVVTDDIDSAFKFFETQNIRGVKLKPVDYLKAYHLRVLKNKERKQRHFARRWDEMNREDFLNHLYSKILWRGRNWKGKEFEYENKDSILMEFQKRLKSNNSGRIKLFPNRQNMLAKNMIFTEDLKLKLKSNFISLDVLPKDYPFSLRQPLEKGDAFFLYTIKYCHLYRLLFDNLCEKVRTGSKEIDCMRKFYKKVYMDSGMSVYLKELFKLATVLYYDKFGDENIYKFAQYLDLFIGAKRIGLKSIYAQTPIKLLREEKQNLLDVIVFSFEPDEVFDFIKENFNKEAYQNEEIETDHKVQGRYKKALLEWYKKDETESLKDRLGWIEDDREDCK